MKDYKLNDNQILQLITHKYIYINEYDSIELYKKQIYIK